MLWTWVKSAIHWTWEKADAGLKWVASIHSEPDGTGSASRVCFSLLVLTVCGVLICHVAVHHTLPDHDTLPELVTSA